MLRSILMVTSTTLTLPAVVQGGILALTAVTCGTKTCASHQYCSEFNSKCENCENICNESSHNFDKTTCVSHCQEYIHDQRYGQNSIPLQQLNELKADHRKIMILLLLTLILFIIVHGLHFFRWLRHRVSCSPRIFKRRKGKEAHLSTVQVNPHTQSPKTPHRVVQQPVPNGRPSTVLSGSVVGESTVGTVSTHLRHPAEDSTLDYTYDNGGLAITPVSDKPKGTETTF